MPIEPILRVAPLSRAYLLSSLTYVLIPVACVYIFGEQIRRLHALTMAPTKVTGSTIAMLDDTCGNLIQLTALDAWGS